MFGVKRSGRSFETLPARIAVRIFGLSAGVAALAGLPFIRPAVAKSDHQAPASPAQAERGGGIYAKHCASCHGPKGQGDGEAGRDLDPQPSNLHDPEIAAASDQKLFRQITRGRRPMPSFGRLLSEDDRWAVVAFVKSLGVADAGRGAR